MKRNEGVLDRIARVVIGGAIFSLAVTGPQTAWGLLGLIPLLTGLIGYCPLYRVLGISSCPARGSDRGTGGVPPDATKPAA